MRFDSQKPPPGSSAFGAPAAAAASSGSQEAAAASDGAASDGAASDGDGAWALRRACVERITLGLAQRLGVQLLGVDVVFAEPEPEPLGARPLGAPTGAPEAEPYVVDLNYFPHGPHSFPGFARALAGLARQRVKSPQRDVGLVTAGESET